MEKTSFPRWPSTLRTWCLSVVAWTAVPWFFTNLPYVFLVLQDPQGGASLDKVLSVLTFHWLVPVIGGVIGTFAVFGGSSSGGGRVPRAGDLPGFHGFDDDSPAQMLNPRTGLTMQPGDILDSGGNSPLGSDYDPWGR